MLVVDIASGKMWEEVLDLRSISMPSPMSLPNIIKWAPTVRTMIDALLSFDDAIAIAKASADVAAEEVKGTPPSKPKTVASSIKTNIIKVKPEKRKSTRRKEPDVKKAKTVIEKNKSEVIPKKNVKRCQEGKLDGATAKGPTIAHVNCNDNDLNTTHVDTNDIAKFLARPPNFTNSVYHAPRRNPEHQQFQEMSQRQQNVHVDEFPYSDGDIPSYFETHRHHNHNINNRHHWYNAYDRRGFDRMGYSGPNYDVHDVKSQEHPSGPQLSAPPRRNTFSQPTPMINAVNQYMLAQANAQMFASAAAADVAAAAAASAMQWW